VFEIELNWRFSLL